MIKKQTLKTKPVCKVTFGLSKNEAEGASTIHLVGEFNDWNKTSTELTRMKSGGFKTVVALPTGQSYQFRYLIDGARWLNDSQADGYAPSGIGNETNGIVAL